MTFEDAQEIVDKWIKEKGVRYFNELTNSLILTEEVGEFSRLMARQFGEQSFKEGEKPLNFKDSIADEIADILFVLICLSNQMNINLKDAFMVNIEKKTKRDANRHFKNEKLTS